ncbi:MAG TPA: hypothetical protein VF832_06490 [Longimicrobiales bacterium]
MRRASRGCWLVLVTMMAAACGGGAATPPPATPAPAAAKVQAPPPDPSSGLLGHWTYTAGVQGETYTGTMDLTRDAQGWHAKVVDNSMGELPVESVAVDGTAITVVVHAGDNPSTVKATLQPDGTVAGKVVAGDAEGTFTAKKG